MFKKDERGAIAMKGMKDTNIQCLSRIIPEGELKCVWMTAGLVAYKLCEQEYDCEFCTFNEAFLGERKFLTIGQAIEGSNDSIETIKTTPDIFEELDKAAYEKVLVENFLKDIFDFKIEKDFLYYYNHTWIEKNNEYVKIGVDDFLCKFITKIKQIIIPPKSTFLSRDHPFCWIIEEFGTIPIVSPLSGNILSLNENLFENPELPLIDPYSKGWFIMLKPKDFQNEKEFLFSYEDGIKEFKNNFLILKQRFTNELFKHLKIEGKSILADKKGLIGLKKIIGQKRFFEIFLNTLTKFYSDFRNL